MCKLQFGLERFTLLTFHRNHPGDKVYRGKHKRPGDDQRHQPRPHFHEGSEQPERDERVRGHHEPAAVFGNASEDLVAPEKRKQHRVQQPDVLRGPLHFLPDFFLLRSEQESYTLPHDIEKPGNYEINPESCPVLGHDSLEQSADQLKDDQQLQNCYKGLSISDRIYPHTLYPEKE